jgi:hypothetical protein
MSKSSDSKNIISEKQCMLDYKLYFGRWSNKWSGGVCYLDDSDIKSNQTYAKMYLISKTQFLDLLAMENGHNPGDLNIDLEFEKEVVVEGLSNYDKLIKLGEFDGYPKITFTSSEIKEYNDPSESYIETISKGLVETFDMTKEKSTEYLESNIEKSLER